MRRLEGARLMPALLDTLSRDAAQAPGRACLVGRPGVLDAATVAREASILAGRLAGHRVALLADNSPAWAVVDLACLQAGVPCVPLPGFFDDAQLRHALLDAGADLVIGDDPGRLRRLVPAAAAGGL